MPDYRSQKLQEPRMMIRELDHRRSDGIDVTLLWNVRTNSVFVSVVDERYDNGFQFRVRASDALDAFRHPYAPHERQDGALAA
jgi:hypothetical protein